MGNCGRASRVAVVALAIALLCAETRWAAPDHEVGIAIQAKKPKAATAQDNQNKSATNEEDAAGVIQISSAAVGKKKKSPPPAKKKSPPPAKNRSPPPPAKKQSWGWGKPAGKPGKPGDHGGIGGGGPPACGGKLKCSVDQFTLDFGNPSLKIKAIGFDMFEVVDLNKLVNSVINKLAMAFCTLVRTGTEVANFGSGANAAADYVFSQSPLGSLKDGFQSLPMDPTNGYILFGWPPIDFGIETNDTAPKSKSDSFKSFISGKGIAIAFDPCNYELLLAFMGFETEPIPVGPVEVSFSLDRFGYSYRAGLEPVEVVGDDTIMDFWTPTGLRSLGPAPSQVFFEGTATIAPTGLDLTFADFSVSGVATVMVNYDPLNNGNVGNNAKDFGLLVNVAAAPSLTLFGAIALPIDKVFPTAVCTIYTRYTDTFQIAAKLLIQNGDLPRMLSDGMPFLPKPVAETIGGIFQASLNVPLESVNVYGGADGWGVMVKMASGSGSLGYLGEMYTRIAEVVPGLPKTINPMFAISGKSSGSGLPIGVTLGFGSKNVTLYFCIEDSQCPGGFNCNMGVCSRFSCPDGTQRSGTELFCFSPCKEGYKMASNGLLSTCWEECPGGTDIGALCSGYCGPDYDKLGGFCYAKCGTRNGKQYQGDIDWCREPCPDGYAGACCTCSRLMHVYSKPCCTSKYVCRDTCKKLGVKYPCKCGWQDVNCGCDNDGYTDDGCTCQRPPSTLGRDYYFRGTGPSSTYTKKSYVKTPSPLILALP